MKNNLFLISILTVSLSANAITEKEYWNVFEEAMRLPLCKISDESPKEIQERYSSSMRACIALDEIAPCESLPFLFAKLEDNSFSNKMIEIYYDKGVITNCLNNYLKKEIFIATKLYFGYKSVGHIAFPWLTGKKDDLTIPATSYPYFWWYEGRKYMPKIWESWYECWKVENERESPRETVLKVLSEEIVDLGYSAFPFIAEKISSGDETLNKIYPRKDIVNLIREDGWKYCLPPCEGLSSCEIRLKGSLIIKKLNFDRMKIWQKNAEAYYRNYNPRDAKYWYWRLPEKDNISFEDIFDLRYNNK